MHENCSKLCSSILIFVSYYPVLQNVNFLLEGTFSLEKWKSKMANCKKRAHVLSKVVKNIIFQNKTLLVMFFRHNKTFWYQFYNFKHFLKAENSEDSLASSCEELCISFRVTQYETVLLLDYSTIMTMLIETLNRKNWRFRDRDRKRLTRCHMASENFDAVLLLNIRVSI